MIAQLQAVKIRDAAAETAGSSWTGLFKIAGWAALLSLVFFPIQIAVFIIQPPPETVTAWFELFHAHPLIGLLDLDLLLMADQVLMASIFLALYIALRRVGQSIMIISLALGLLSVVLFIASNPAFAMQSVSRQYFAASNEAERTALLAAGQSLIASWQGSAFQVSYLVGSITPMLIAVVMLRTRLFRKATAYLGILSNAIALGLYVPVIGVYISVFSVVFLWVWYLLLAGDLFKLASQNGEATNE